MAGTSIDEFVAAHNLQPDFVKLDAESAEMVILEGMSQTLVESSPIISVEVGDEVGVEEAASSELLSYLLDHGYTAFTLEGSKRVPHEIKQSCFYDNIMMFPGEKNAGPR